MKKKCFFFSRMYFCVLKRFSFFMLFLSFLDTATAKTRMVKKETSKKKKSEKSAKKDSNAIFNPVAKKPTNC